MGELFPDYDGSAQSGSHAGLYLATGRNRRPRFLKGAAGSAGRRWRRRRANLDRRAGSRLWIEAPFPSPLAGEGNYTLTL